MANSKALGSTEPILRWVGGKRQLLPYLLDRLPAGIESLRYFEPFLGAGSLFFSLVPAKAFLSDANRHLVHTYEHIKRQPDLVYSYLRTHSNSSCEEYYYRIRDSYNHSVFSTAQASRFIYLNKTCFNGIFRVNQKGAFNVPYGRKEPPALPTLAQLRNASKALSMATLGACQYRDAIKDCSKGDFVYLDPPYPPINGTAYFTHYTSDRFGMSDQEELGALVHELSARKVLFMMTNADTPLIRKLYGHYHITEVPVIRYVTCKSKKYSARELIITNYKDFLGRLF